MRDATCTAVSLAATKAFACLSFSPPSVRSGCRFHRLFRQRYQRTKCDLLNRNSERRIRPRWNRTLTAEHQHQVHKSPVSVGETTAYIYNNTLHRNSTTFFSVPLNTTLWCFVFAFNHICHITALRQKSAALHLNRMYLLFLPLPLYPIRR